MFSNPEKVLKQVRMKAKNAYSFYIFSTDLKMHIILLAWLHLPTTMSKHRSLSFHLSSVALSFLSMDLTGCVASQIGLCSSMNVHADRRWLQKCESASLAWRTENTSFCVYLLLSHQRLCFLTNIPGNKKNGCCSTQHTKQVLPVMHNWNVKQN